MSQRVSNQLRRARASKADWTPLQLLRLYEEYGFIIRHGGKHDVVVHPEHPDLRATVTRSSPLATGYVAYAVRLIDALIERQTGGGKQ